MQWLRFGRGTVPGLVLDGEKTIGSRRSCSLEAARRQFPGFPGEIPTRTVPADWLPASTPA
jgi:hypothetical protein